MAKKLGELLLSKGLVARAELNQALMAQPVHGGRLGTILIQSCGCTIDDVGRCLSNQAGVPYADSAQLEETLLHITALSGDLCAEHAVVPIRTEDKTLHLAMRDPLRQIAGAISFATGLTIRKYVAPELRIYYYLEKYYGIPREPRFLRVPDGGEGDPQRRTYIGADGQGGPSPAPSSGDQEPALEIVPLDQYQAGVQPAPESRLDQILRRLDAATSGKELARALVEAPFERATKSILFGIRGTCAVALLATEASPPLPPQHLQRLVVPLNSHSLLQQSFQAIGLVHGTLATHPYQGQVAAYLGWPAPAQTWVVPVVLSGQVYLLVCLQIADDRELTEADVAGLHQLAERAATRCATIAPPA